MADESKDADTSSPSLWRESQAAAKEEKTGIAGPLLLVAIGCVIGPILSGWELWQSAALFVQPELWSALNDPKSETYHRLWMPVIMYETAGAALLFFGDLVLAWLFFTRRRLLPPAIIGFMLFIAAFYWGDYWLAGMVPLIAESDGGSGLRDAIRTTISAAIWCPYFLISERVKNTFTR